MAPSRGFAAASHREAALRGAPPPMARPRSEAQWGSVRPAAAMRSTRHRAARRHRTFANGKIPVARAGRHSVEFRELRGWFEAEPWYTSRELLERLQAE
jgi:hypothetical protein